VIHSDHTQIKIRLDTRSNLKLTNRVTGCNSIDVRDIHIRSMQNPGMQSGFKRCIQAQRNVTKGSTIAYVKRDSDESPILSLSTNN
jgi:hypothetical protein